MSVFAVASSSRIAASLASSAAFCCWSEMSSAGGFRLSGGRGGGRAEYRFAHAPPAVICFRRRRSGHPRQSAARPRPSSLLWRRRILPTSRLWFTQMSWASRGEAPCWLEWMTWSFSGRHAYQPLRATRTAKCRHFARRFEIDCCSSPYRRRAPTAASASRL